MTAPRKKIMIFVVTLVAMSVVGGILYGISMIARHNESLTTTTFHYNHVKGAEIVLYKGAKKDLVEPLTQGEPTPLADGEKRRLENWPYVVVVRGDDIEEVKQVVYPQQVDQTVVVTVAKQASTLETELTAETDNLVATIDAVNPQLTRFYTIEDMKLHGDGTWASARLAYIGENKLQRDPLHVVLQRTNGTWQIAAGPALTIHRSDKLKDAPQSVLWSVIPAPVAAS